MIEFNSKFSAAMNRVISSKAVSPKGKAIDYKFRAIMVRYVDLLCLGYTAKEIEEELNINKYDVANWHEEFKDFGEYVDYRVENSGWERMEISYIYALLGRAALGECELSPGQLSAIKLLMQARGVSGGVKKSGGKEKSVEFVVE